jgi:hypothetical protein
MTGLKFMIEDAVTLASVLRDDLRRNKLRSIEIELHGGDLDNLEKTIGKSLEHFSNFEFPGRLPMPIAGNNSTDRSRLTYRSRSNEPIKRVTRRSQSPVSHCEEERSCSVVKKVKRKSKSLPARALAIDLTVHSDDEQHEFSRGRTREEAIDLTNDSEDEKPKSKVTQDVHKPISFTFLGHKVQPPQLSSGNQDRPLTSLKAQALQHTFEDTEYLETFHQNSSPVVKLHEAFVMGHDFIGLH